ncbi:MAG: heme NO-binding domain-containing protein [Xanthomonadales bacterium]|nr:heme NO-binding domain-containing protein [Gammaproteobacteria bacterium]MBT8052434.1 heme NO-binding domain-containing protein [Gammaproteobacteria bacterium]NND55951.1 heme NO-binding domain-containing protein [Xanthomonadales bacterium]NNK50536.1 heme NO-binding domain-containing protein [Xanthomonadales bacterium]
MKGIIFTSFIDFAEQQLGLEFVDEMLDTMPLSTGGAYTNVGTYPAQEMLDMVEYVLQRHDLDPAALQQAFGEHTFKVLTDRHGDLVESFKDSFDCIFHVDQTIHRNVLKLYPDAELPNMHAKLSDEGRRLTMEYRSERPLMHVAFGLINGCIKHFNDRVEVAMTDLSDGAGTHASFVLTREDTGPTSAAEPAA